MIISKDPVRLKIGKNWGMDKIEYIVNLIIAKLRILDAGLKHGREDKET